MVDYDFLKKKLPVRVVLPDSKIRPEFYETAEAPSRVQLCDAVFIWLDEMLGSGSECDQPLKIIIKHANWYIERVELEYDPGSGRQFAVRFRNEDDASWFKLTWL